MLWGQLFRRDIENLIRSNPFIIMMAFSSVFILNSSNTIAVLAFHIFPGLYGDLKCWIPSFFPRV